MYSFHGASPFASSSSWSAEKEGYFSKEHYPDQTSPSSSPRANEPYSQLIHKALMSVPSRSMTLRQIYQWFRKNTDKAINGNNGGWKNSIRHNLSMNKVSDSLRHSLQEEISANEEAQAFINRSKDRKWVLQDWAVEKGVQSTTRYRPKPATPAERTAASRRRMADRDRRINDTSSNSSSAASFAGHKAVLASNIGQQGTSPSYEGSDQATRSDLNHQSCKMEDSPSSSPGIYYDPPQQHSYHYDYLHPDYSQHLQGASSYSHESALSQHWSLSMNPMPTYHRQENLESHWLSNPHL